MPVISLVEEFSLDYAMAHTADALVRMGRTTVAYHSNALVCLLSPQVPDTYHEKGKGRTEDADIEADQRHHHYEQ